MYEGFSPHKLDSEHTLWIGQLPDHLRLTESQFAELWASHPEGFHRIKMHGRIVATPRWQQAFGADYYYTGTVNKALPVPPLLEPLLAWACQAIEKRLNGLLLNWYDGRLGHYIGKHRDSTHNMVAATPIVTVSFGEERIFRLRPWKGAGYADFPATNASVFILPFATNLTWTHEVPSFAHHCGQRVSVTMRAFSG